MSDRGKGLVPAVTEVFPGNEHSTVLCNIGRNIVRNYKMKYLHELAYAASKEDCERQLEKTKEASESVIHSFKDGSVILLKKLNRGFPLTFFLKFSLCRLFKNYAFLEKVF